MDTRMQTELSAMIREISGRQRRDFDRENRVLLLSVLNPGAGPRELCELYPARFGMTDDTPLTENDMIRTLRACRLNQPKERGKVAAAAAAAGTHLAELFHGRNGAEAALRRSVDACPSHKQTARMILLAAEDSAGRALDGQTHRALRRLNADFARECLDALLERCLPPAAQPADAREQELQRLRADLARARTLLDSLQEDFENRLEEYRAEEREQFFSQLNSEEYGCILDLLSSARRGFRKMRAQKQPIPAGLRPVQTLVRRMLDFTNDCGVEPMLEPGTLLTLRAANLAEYRYEGTPFAGDADTKQVRIVSPGWRITERGIIISCPGAAECAPEDIEETESDNH